MRYALPSGKSGHVLVRTPGRKRLVISAPEMGYVRRSEIGQVSIVDVDGVADEHV
jgi:hypothetical protein